MTKLLVKVCYSFLNATSRHFFLADLFQRPFLTWECLVKSCILLAFLAWKLTSGDDFRPRVPRPDLPLAAVQAAECLAVLGAVARLDCILRLLGGYFGWKSLKIGPAVAFPGFGMQSIHDKFVGLSCC